HLLEIGGHVRVVTEEVHVVERDVDDVLHTVAKLASRPAYNRRRRGLESRSANRGHQRNHERSRHAQRDGKQLPSVKPSHHVDRPPSRYEPSMDERVTITHSGVSQGVPEVTIRQTLRTTNDHLTLCGRAVPMDLW